MRTSRRCFVIQVVTIKPRWQRNVDALILGFTIVMIVFDIVNVTAHRIIEHDVINGMKPFVSVI